MASVSLSKLDVLRNLKDLVEALGSFKLIFFAGLFNNLRLKFGLPLKNAVQYLLSMSFN